MKISYARVSTEDQNLDMQMDALNKIECDKIFTDKMSGARSDRPGLEKAMKFILIFYSISEYIWDTIIFFHYCIKQDHKYGIRKKKYKNCC